MINILTNRQVAKDSTNLNGVASLGIENLGTEEDFLTKVINTAKSVNDEFQVKLHEEEQRISASENPEEKPKTWVGKRIGPEFSFEVERSYWSKEEFSIKGNVAQGSHYFFSEVRMPSWVLSDTISDEVRTELFSQGLKAIMGELNLKLMLLENSGGKEIEEPLPF